MYEANNTFLDLAKTVGFILAVILGGLLIASLVDFWNPLAGREGAVDVPTVAEDWTGD